MATKNFAAKVTIGGALQSSFSSAFGGANRAIEKLGNTVKDLSRQRATIKGFQQSTANVEKFGNELTKAKAKLDAARSALSAAKTPTAALVREVQKAETHVSSLNNRIDAERTKLGQLKEKLDAARISTSKLGEADAKLEARIKRSADLMRSHSEKVEKFGQARARFGSMVAAGIGVGVAMASFRPALKASDEFADILVDVSKYIDGADTPEKLQEIGEQIREIGRNSPLGAKGLAALAIGAGKLGMAAPEALEFGKAMETMAGGLDLTAEEAAEKLTKIKSSMRLTIPEVVKLGDAMNYLGDITASDSQKIVDIVMRQGGVVKATTKLTNAEIAALAAQFDIASSSAEEGATSMKNFIKALTVGKAASKGNEWAFGVLKLKPEEVAAGMQKDAKKTIELVLQRLSKVAEKDQGAVLSKLFGEESKGSIVNVVRAYEDLAKSFRLVGDEANFAGRSAKEQERNLEKWGTQSKILRSQLFDLGISIGDAVKEGLAPMLKMVNPLLERFAKWRKENPKLFAGIVQVTAGIIGLAAAAVGIGLAVSAASVAWSGLAVVFSAVSVLGAPVIAAFAAIGAAVVAAALLIRKYWEPMKAWFSGVWQGITEGWESSGAGELFKGMGGLFESVKDAIIDFLKPVSMTDEEFKKTFESGRAFGEWIGSTFGACIQVAVKAIEWLVEKVTWLKDVFVGAFQSIKSDVTAVFDAIAAKIDWVGKKMEWLGGAIGLGSKATSSISPSNFNGGGLMAPNAKATAFNPPAVRGGNGGPQTVKIDVHGAPGQSEEAIAQNVMRKLQDQQGGRVNLYDEATA